MRGSSKKTVRQMSKGMRMKLALVMALSHRPRLLILDEPTSGLDPLVRRELLEQISGVIRDEGRTVIFSSHIIHDVEQVADYVAILQEGVIAVHADKESLLDRWRRANGVRGAPEELRPLFRSLQTDGLSFVGTTGCYSQEWLSRLQATGAADLRVNRVSLEEILLAAGLHYPLVMLPVEPVFQDGVIPLCGQQPR